MSLVYYVPGLTDARRGAIEERCLGHIFDPEPFPFSYLGANGPDGSNGLLVAAGEGKGVGKAVHTHEWRKAPGERDWWIGVAGETPPQALARKEQIAGHEVELGDGRRWIVPVARTFGLGTRLPQRLVLGPDGETWEGEPLERYAKISAKAERIERACLGDLGDDEEPVHVMGEGATVAVEALALNYRIGPVEASALGLLTEPVVFRVLWAFIDGPTLDAVVKEREEAAKERRPLGTPDGSSSSDGAEA
jgi:hypothetical protein